VTGRAERVRAERVPLVAELGNFAVGAAWVKASGAHRVGRFIVRLVRGGARSRSEPMIAIERAGDLHQWGKSPHVAAVDQRVGEAQRLGQPRNLQMNVSLGRSSRRSAMTRSIPHKMEAQKIEKIEKSDNSTDVYGQLKRD
jgi:hypothetical protein